MHASLFHLFLEMQMILFVLFHITRILILQVDCVTHLYMNHPAGTIRGSDPLWKILESNSNSLSWMNGTELPAEHWKRLERIDY